MVTFVRQETIPPSEPRGDGESAAFRFDNSQVGIHFHGVEVSGFNTAVQGKDSVADLKFEDSQIRRTQVERDYAKEWKDTADRFNKLDSAVRADWHSCNNKETWRIAGGLNRETEALCRIAGSLLIKSPRVWATLPSELIEEKDALNRWLFFLKTKGYLRGFQHATEKVPGQETVLHLMASIEYLGQASSNICLDCAANEV